MTRTGDRRGRAGDRTGRGSGWLRTAGGGLRPVLVAAIPLAVVAVIAGLALTGAAAPTVLGDPGAGVRWGLPIVTVLAELAAAVSLGSLLLATGVFPPDPVLRPVPSALLSLSARSPLSARPEPSPWRRAVLIAGFATSCWAVLLMVQTVLSYASAAGLALTDPAFGDQLAMFLTEVDLGRYLAISVGIVAVTAAIALLARTATAAAWALGLGLAALVPQSLSGHAAGTANHEIAVTALGLHLGGSALWIGGLAALAIVAVLGGGDAVTVSALRRFSTLAAWCFGAVALSGIINAALRLGDWSGLLSAYGVLVLVKSAALGLLGLAGLAHRRAVIARLDHAAELDGTADMGAAADVGGAAELDDGRHRHEGAGRSLSTRRRLFWRLVAAELAIMAIASGLAVALSASAPPVPPRAPVDPTPAEALTGSPLPPEPTVGSWMTSWRPDLLLLLVAAVSAGLYLAGVIRLRRRGDRWPGARTVVFVAGTVLLAWVTSGGPAVYGRVLFSGHMIQHMLLAMVVPLLLVVGAPVTLALRALPARPDGSRGPREWLLAVVGSRWVRFWANPVVAAVNFAGSMVVFYYTDLFRLALETHLGHLAMMVHFTLAGYLFANALIGIDPGPRRPSYPLRLVLLFATMAFHAFFGLALMSSTTLFVPEWFGALGRTWGAAPLADQHDGGGIAWGIGELPTLVLAVVVAVQWARDDDRVARRTDRAADRDGDRELTEYNEMLAALAERDSASQSSDESRAPGRIGRLSD